MSDLCVPVMTNSGTRIKHYSSGPNSALHGTCTAETIVGAGSFLGARSRLVPSPLEGSSMNV